MEQRRFSIPSADDAKPAAADLRKLLDNAPPVEGFNRRLAPVPTAVALLAEPVASPTPATPTTGEEVKLEAEPTIARKPKSTKRALGEKVEVSVVLPRYVRKALAVEGRKRNVTRSFLVLEALSKQGYTVDEADLKSAAAFLADRD